VSTSIDLNSVDTLILVRNERFKVLFFEAEKFPQAIAKAWLDLVEIKALRAGQLITQQVEVNLDLHGVNMDKPVSGNRLVSKQLY